MVRIAAVSVMVIAAWAAGTPVKVTFTPDQTGTVSAPVVGLGGTSSDYLLTNQFGTSLLDKNFDGNNQERTTGWEEGNPTTAQDAASFDDHYMFQLSNTDGIRKVDLSNGAQVLINGQLGINAGAYSFGIGYDATANSIGIGNFNPHTSMMSFSKYDLGTGELTPLISFAFDTSTYGTPSGLDFVNMNGHLRMLIGTRDAPDDRGRPNAMNFILDMNASNGTIDQYFTTHGLGNKLQDVLYEDGQIMLANQSGGSGFVQVGAYTPYHPYDFDGDGRIDTADVALLASGWLSPRTALYRGPVPEGLDDDGVVNLEDWAALARYWPGGIEND